MEGGGKFTITFSLAQGVCQIREIREKSGKSILHEKCRGEIREKCHFRENEGNIIEITCPCIAHLDV